LNANPGLSIPLSKAEAAGRKVIMPQKLITEEIGYTASFIDSEGK
jgi:predicted enzyme related to lactoylglutathione lyase